MYVDQTGQLGGGELSLLDVIRSSSLPSEITLFADGPFRKALDGIGIRVHVLSGKSVGKIRRQASMGAVLGAIPQLAAMRRGLKQLAQGFDVLYANSQKAFLVSAIAKRRNQVLVWHLRDMLTASHFSSMARRVAVFMGNHVASVVIVNSRATADSFVEAGGRADLARIIYNGIDVGPFDRVDDEKVQGFRESLALSGKFVVGVFGRISPWKGQMVLLEAVAALKDIHVMVVGDALFNENNYKEELQRRAALPDLQGRVHFLGFQDDVPLLMKAVDVVAHTSTSPEPFGRVIVEAMLAERPVVATRAGGALEILEEGQTGLLVSPGSVAELEGALLKLQGDPGLRERLVLASKRSAQERFSVQAMADGIQGLLAELVR
jgi:glycosyltransferase involved in cell wall biosynthesis